MLCSCALLVFEDRILYVVFHEEQLLFHKEFDIGLKNGGELWRLQKYREGQRRKKEDEKKILPGIAAAGSRLS